MIQEYDFDQQSRVNLTAFYREELLYIHKRQRPPPKFTAINMRTLCKLGLVLISRTGNRGIHIYTLSDMCLKLIRKNRGIV